MKNKIYTFATILFLSIKLFAQGQPSPILETKETGAFPLVETTATPIYVDDKDLNTVRKATTWLQHDIELVTGKKPNIINTLSSPPPQYIVIIGSLTSLR